MKRVSSTTGLAMIAMLISSCTAPLMLASGAASLITKRMAEKRIQDENRLKYSTATTGLMELVSAQTAAQYYAIGQQYINKDNDDMALVALQKALRLEPEHLESMSALAVIYAKRQHLVQSIQLFEQVVALNSNAKNLNNLGYAYYLNKQYVEANRVLRQAIAINPEHTLAKNNLALVQANLNADHAVAQSKDTFVVISDKKELPQAFDQNPTPDPVQVVTAIQSAQEPIIQKQVKTYDPLVAISNSVFELKLPEFKPTFETESINYQPIFAVASGGTVLKYIDSQDRFFNSAPNSFVAIQQLNKLEIVNANGTKSLARTVADSFYIRGVTKVSTRDAKGFNVAKTQIQYRPGFRSEAVALKQLLKISPLIYLNEKLPEQIQVKLVLGRDIP